MIKVFNGSWRGLGESEDRFGLILDFQFRDIIHHFKGAKLHVLLALCLHSDDNGFCYPSYDTLERETGYSRGTISSAIQELCEMEVDGHRVLMKWRERDEEGHFQGSNRYRVFPTEQEIGALNNPEFNNRTVEKPYCGKSELEVKPPSKGKPLNGSSADADVPDKEELSYDEKRTILEEHFSSVTGIPLPKRRTKKEKKAAGALWWGPLKDILDWCDRDVWAAKRIISAAVKEMDAESLTIKAPKSIIGNATDVFRKQNGGGSSNGTEYAWKRVMKMGNPADGESFTQPHSVAQEETLPDGRIIRAVKRNGSWYDVWVLHERNGSGDWHPVHADEKEKQVA